MKLLHKLALLGTVAFIGLSGGVWAQDLGILRQLTGCETLGIEGMTISSGHSCLRMRGGVTYEYDAGQFRDEATIAVTPDARRIAVGGPGLDWDTRVKTWLELVATSETDYGLSTATVKLGNEFSQRFWATPDGYTYSGTPTDSSHGNGQITIDEAFIAIGDTTKVMVGKKGSIANLADDQPFNFLSSFLTSSYDGGGIGLGNDSKHLGGQVMQLQGKLTDELTLGVGLEALDKSEGDTKGSSGGTALGVLSYAADGVTAHLTAGAFDLAGGGARSWLLHSGTSVYFDGFKVRAAAAYRNNATDEGWNHFQAMATAEAHYKMLSFAATSEILHATNVATGNFTSFGLAGSVGASFHEYVFGNLGLRYFRDGYTGLDTTQVAAQLRTTVTETVTVTNEVGVYWGSQLRQQQAAGKIVNDTIAYAATEVSVAPGGGFKASLRGEVNSENAYKVSVRASKEFQ